MTDHIKQEQTVGNGKMIHKAIEASGDNKEVKPSSYLRLQTMEMIGIMQISNVCGRRYFN